MTQPTAKKRRTRSTKQVDIFDGIPKPSHHGCDLQGTSVLANRVLRALTSRGASGGSRDELAEDTGLTAEQVGSALGELHLWQRARKTEAVRLSPRGGHCHVYIATE